MPDNIICPTCGREYPWQVPRSYCLSCKTYFTRGTCCICRTYSEHLNHGECLECHRAQNRKTNYKHRAAAKQSYIDWVIMVTSVPKPVQTLMEEEWEHTCRYFGGCALCGEPQIESRVFFVPAHKGGTYTRFNVIPCCEKCTTSYKRTIKASSDPFSDSMNNQYSRVQLNRMEKLKAYLKEQYDEYRKSQGI